jgi:glycosyltransferase involved in cell wall biosynthesis
LIPTYKRPVLLRAALESVRNQSRPDLIAAVIVSENSTDPGSEDVCRDFSDLPIRFVRQTVALEPYCHFSRIVELAETEHVALLGDDDMWGRYHIEEAARQLSAHQNAVAYIGGTAFVSDSSRAISSQGQLVAQSRIPPYSDRFADCWVWSAQEILLASLLCTPLNMWAIVGRRDNLLKAMEVFTEPNQGIDADRIMIWELSRLGEIVIGREMSLFYRVHSDNACARMLAESPMHHRQASHAYTRRMLREASDMGIDARTLWLDMTSRMTPQQWNDVRTFSGNLEGSRDALVAAWGDDAGHPRNPDLRAMVRDILPPFLHRALARIMRKTT